METDTVSTSTPAAVAERLFQTTLNALELLHVYLGDRLGLYRALADCSPLSPPELGERAAIAPRYGREWLEQQAVAGYVDVAESSEDPDARRYALGAGHAELATQLAGLASHRPRAEAGR